MRTYNKGKRNEFRACNSLCASSFRCDRQHGLIYGPSRVRDDDGTIHWCLDQEEFSRLTDSCAYCGADNP